MCGIAGFVTRNGRPVETERLRVMAGKLAHRGPDGEGIWSHGPAGLAHRRLAIVDLSENGAQPMVSLDGRYAITFNGEIYNYQELTEQLAASGKRLRSKSDTEVLLALYEREGERMLDKLRGMFAFAIWDTRDQKLFFARDRIGKKPFYYRHSSDEFAFASEPLPLIRGGEQIDYEAIRLFFGLQYIPSPYTGWKEIRHLQPGESGTLQDGVLKINKYFSFKREPKVEVSFDVAVKEVRRLLEDSIRLRMIADVDVGTFLSGGIDSSAIACLMAKRSSVPIKTFTMGFPVSGYDERAEARLLANKIKSDHREFLVTPEDALSVIDPVLEKFGVPFADSSAIPTYLLARETSGYVKAVMTGDGGDELFGGYRRYGYLKQAKRLAAWHLGNPVNFATSTISAFSGSSSLKRFGESVLAAEESTANGYAEMFVGAYFGSRLSKKLFTEDFLLKTAESSDAINFIEKMYNEDLGVEGALDFDLRSYLPDDLNVKMDRASMAHGLEARSPLLDQELVSYVISLPSNFLLSDRGNKRLLVSALKDVVPPEVFIRPKRGFQVPLASWFRNELRSVFVERCLSSDAAIAQICRMDEMKKLLNENDKGRDHGNRLWMLLSLSTWLETYV